ncbi:Zn(II)2Cys6 transcription factor [Aspergillus brunneoviolaceus CBS 621.78]|uniref:Uncharacterized protein n=1 Tax=Aspergillus brunneoviolaceus CBS 621.78 TaxID=1450534 RepID=A0ACD1FWQ4_9EURO|nr:hypothetical protein BO95DRAFT_506922 [Aspergillus brunneoviolaceus CBS 621.78]RAH41389.1 hypothetical protein BO95DRAFT_506922 [Aspergillus brunneoviolaceus CBS 621.78]
MGRSSWRAQSCRTCLARKVKCDMTRPKCTRCQSSKLTCGGYSRISNATIGHRTHTSHPIHLAHTTFECGQQSLVVYQDQIQLIAHFLDDYLPPKTPDAVTYQSPVNWAETFSSFLEAQSPIVHRLLVALTLNHAANSRHDDTLTQRSRQQYELAVQQICALNELNQPTDLIRSGMILALYESYTYPPAQNSGAWQAHVQAACNIVRQLEAPTTVLGKQDVRRLRTVDVYLCFLSSGMGTY